ncbi:MAG TPA: aspartate aminotransferase family protein [Candidatus Acidoferrum sp.]|jgi:adenosylmethionine-8-amino-7-oxononanoate aminotransferase
MKKSSALFPRNFRKDLPIAVRGEGSWIFTADGRRLLDASGQAAVVSIGHGVAEIGRAMAEQASQIAFAHTTQFHSAPAERLAERLLALAPPNFRDGGRVYFTSGGSEATETAIKLARQYWLERGDSNRFRVVSRRQSYHGSTLGAMSISGNVGRRAPYQPLLAEWGHIAPCFCYHCPFELKYPECSLACANDLETLLKSSATNIAAFIFEPVVGATLGAAAPPDGYVARIAEICRRHNILLIADEIMSGMGRTGKTFAAQHWNVEPDLILVGKGIASGYAPLGAVLVSRQIAEAFESGTGAFQHGFTYQAHPVATAAGNAVFDFIEAQELFERVSPAGKRLRSSLTQLEAHPNVGEIRGLGLFLGIEFVKDKSTREPFPREENIAEKIRQAALAENVLTYPSQGCVDGSRGDHVLLAPPFVLTPAESEIIARALGAALARVFST